MTPTPESVRAEVEEWLAVHWDPDLPLAQWRRLLRESGWAAPAWNPRWHGRGLPAWSERVVAEALAAAGAVGPPTHSGMSLAAPTILEHGSDGLCERFLAPILDGTETWCQLFSEPGAGSVLAGLATTAVLDGDRWIVNGQKVWNTSAHHADFAMLVARTDWDAPKHRGLTYLVLPMHQPGVEVHPLRQMNFHASFNEVFLTDAEIPREWTVGEPGEGWAAALTTLSYERRFGAAAAKPRFRGAGRAVEEAAAEAEDQYETYKWYPQRAGRVDLLVEHARAAGRTDDPVVRQEIARTIAMHRASVWTSSRAAAGRALGRPPGPEGSIGKLATSHVARQAARTHALIAGAAGLLSGPESVMDGLIAEILVSVPAQSIAGGTDEVQRNILGERSLGLPREPSSDSDRPFREVPRNAR